MNEHEEDIPKDISRNNDTEIRECEPNMQDKTIEDKRVVDSCDNDGNFVTDDGNVKLDLNFLLSCWDQAYPDHRYHQLDFDKIFDILLDYFGQPIQNVNYEQFFGPELFKIPTILMQNKFDSKYWPDGYETSIEFTEWKKKWVCQQSAAQPDVVLRRNVNHFIAMYFRRNALRPITRAFFYKLFETRFPTDTNLLPPNLREDILRDIESLAVTNPVWNLKVSLPEKYREMFPQCMES